MSDTAEKPLFCANCGERNPRTNKFCGSCGTVLVVPPSGPASEVVAPAPAPIPSQPVAPTVAPQQQAVRPEPAPVPQIEIPRDPLARERELERLLTRANVERARALIRDSRKTLGQALVLAEHISPSAAAPVYEQLGDLLAAEERLVEAREHFEKALAVSKGERASAEKKLAEVSLRLSDQEAMARLGGALAPSEDLAAVLQAPRAGRRHAGMAMLLSLVPGFGQFYCGQILKAAAILGVFVVAITVVMLQPDRDALFEHLAGAFAFASGKIKSPAPNTLTVVFAVIAFSAWVYSVADAPFTAGKTEEADSPHLTPTPMGSRSDWEP
ncbi:zinc-ribbon domain-containing protein [Armatimonas rosea]|uniref:Tetratricopeptide (TPR) repeat protein n=1 Tax=Armatimonas rosea TaxID=685828 RepID=A0A7W9W7C5_ARMRO|nr:zinc-ribbon domain-containing protein [Armatimonas rosea]MBB6052324.1 tetratricopeptide (TPR) repeat protein [Armatimonas rosea]